MSILNEIFNIDDEVKFEYVNNAYYASFVVNDVKYLVQFIKLGKEHTLYQRLLTSTVSQNSKRIITNHTYFVGFAARYNGKLTDDKINIHNAGSVIKIISTIVNAIEKFIKEHSADCIYFGASESDASRVKLYKTIIRRYAAQNQVNIVDEYVIPFEGGKHIWVVTK
jgi:hypothetical protein